MTLQHGYVPFSNSQSVNKLYSDQYETLQTIKTTHKVCHLRTLLFNVDTPFCKAYARNIQNWK